LSKKRGINAQSAYAENGGFNGKLGYVIATAASAVGLGNIWRFPYLCAKYGGGAFLLVYLILVLSFGYTMIMSETMVGRITRKSPLGAFSALKNTKLSKFGGFLNAVVPFIIMPYYCVIGGWIIKFMIEFIRGKAQIMAGPTYFNSFIGNTGNAEVYTIIFAILSFIIILLGVQKGVEKSAKFMMPALIVLAVVISVYSCTRPGSSAGLKYLFVPNFHNFSIMTVVSALGQMFFSLSLAMGIMITYGSYQEDGVDPEQATSEIEIFDTVIAVLAGLMIIPAIFAFSGGDPDILASGPSLMFVTLPKVFASMGGGNVIGAIFFLLVLFAALTSSVSIAEACVATLQDETNWNRNLSTIIFAVYTIALGTLCCCGYGVWSDFTIGGMQILDFMDFLSNSIIMPLAALATCILISYGVTVQKMDEEIELVSKFKRKKLYNINIKYICPIFLVVIFVSSVLNVFGVISM